MTTVRCCVNTSNAPVTIGADSHAVIADKLMFISGQIGIDVETGNLVDGGVVAETEKALNNMGAILQAGNSSYDKVVKTTVLLDDINNFPAVNDAYTKYFSEKQPARATYQVAALPKGAKVEIEAIAIVGAVKDQ